MVLSPAQQHLLRQLEDGQFHSGQALGNTLGVSRAAVWKHLQSLQQLGISLESQARRGYRWCQPFSMLNADAIQAALTPEAQPLLTQLDILPSVDSTNSHLLRQASQGGIVGRVLLAEQQTHGKGRRGRSWVSPVSGNIYLSIGGHFEQGVAALEGMSLAVAVAVVDALNGLGVQGLALKWPNDLLLNGKKLGGILLEIGGDLNGQGYLVAGLGLNYALSATQADSILQPWASLSQQAPPPARARLVAALLSHLLPLLSTYPHTGFAPYKARWEALNAYCGETLAITMGGHSFHGICQQLSANGGLYVQTAEGLKLLQGGEISLRPNHDT